MSATSRTGRPTAIYANPVLLDLIDREMKAEFNVVLSTTEVAAGLKVKTLSTQAGELPLAHLVGQLLNLPQDELEAVDRREQ